MSLELSEGAENAFGRQTIEPNLVCEIDGYENLLGAIGIKRFIRIGDEGLEIADPELSPAGFYIGGFSLIDDQLTAISKTGTSKNIKQTLNIDRGVGSTISSFVLELIDIRGKLTDLITPGKILDDILGRDVVIYYGVDETAWPEDYTIVFRGTIAEVESTAGGTIVLKINSPENKQRSEIFKEIDANLVGAIDNVTTTIELDSNEGFLFPIQGPDGLIDPTFQAGVRIDDEVIFFDGFSGNQLTGVQRGQLGTTAAAHNDQAQVQSFYVLEGNCIDLALKLMLSGWNGPYLENLEATSVNFINGSLNVPNALFFNSVKLKQRYGISEGDFVTVTGSAVGGNNVTSVPILTIIETQDGDYMILDASLTTETDSTAVISVRSQYDTLPEGFQMKGADVDVDEHLRLQRLFLSTFSYRFFIREDSIEKEFLDQQIYSPIACYSLPRKAAASVGYHFPPIPNEVIKTIDQTRVTNPEKSRIRRSTNRYFFNEIVYSFDESVVENDRFLSGRITISADSKNRIKNVDKTLNIEAKGLRTDLQGSTLASSQSLRRLDRYKFGSEIVSVNTVFGYSVPIEIGDIVIYNGAGLNLPDTKKGQRDIEARFFEVQQKNIDLLSGKTSFELVDTNFLGAGRYCLVSSSSEIRDGVSTTEFIIETSFTESLGVNEFRKYENLKKFTLRVRSPDFAFDEFAEVDEITSNTVVLQTPLSQVPQPGWICELTLYNDAEAQTKLIYGFMTDETEFDDGGEPYLML